MTSQPYAPTVEVLPDGSLRCTVCGGKSNGGAHGPRNCSGNVTAAREPLISQATLREIERVSAQRTEPDHEPERRTYWFEPASERNKTSKEDKHMLFIRGPFGSGTARIGLSDAELDEMIAKAIAYREGR